ncbi:outer membrane autotransporter protein [Paraburkholderia sp. WSM4179]|nr:outer membrane autotransporter protein [Paraburkholderia sp. WSM4179]
MQIEGCTKAAQSWPSLTEHSVTVPMTRPNADCWHGKFRQLMQRGPIAAAASPNHSFPCQRPSTLGSQAFRSGAPPSAFDNFLYHPAKIMRVGMANPDASDEGAPKSALTTFRLVVFPLLAALGATGAADLVHAQSITTTGNVTPTAQLPSTSTITGPVQAPAAVGVGNGTNGSLTIEGGASVTSNTGSVDRNIWGVGAGNMATVIVTGPGSTFTSSPANASNLELGQNGGMGNLTIENSGTVNAPFLRVGSGVNGPPDTTGGTGFIAITSGGALNITGSPFATADQIGWLSNSVGTVTVNGTGGGATYTSGPQISVGWAGVGTLNIINGGLTTANGGMDVAVLANSTGTVNVNGGGTLATTFLTAGCDPVRIGQQGCTSVQKGNAQLNFNDGTLRALTSNSGFLTAFSGTELNIMAGGLSIDSQDFTVATDTTSAFTGAGGLTKIGSGTFITNAANSYSGVTTVTAGTLAAGAVDVFSPNSATVVNPGGTLALQSFNQTLPSLSNAGAVVLPAIAGESSPATTLTVNGSYSGSGGHLVLNSFLGGDGSASDKLITGSASGTTSIFVNNVGGPGASTPGNGILVVQQASAATPGVFDLDNPELRAGLFDYRLYPGGRNGTDPTSWFLRSSFIVPPPPGPPPEPPGPPGPPQPPGPEENVGTEPPPQPSPPGVWPIIGPELATYGVVQPIARQMGLTMLGTLHERIGDTLTAAGGGTDGSGWAQSAWGRVFGQQVDNHYQAFADPRASGWVGGLQTGLDLWRGSIWPGHRDTAGVYFAYGYGNVDVDGLVTNAAATGYVLEHTGSMHLNAYSGGGYWTHYGPSGWYLDAVLQGTYYDGNAGTQYASLPLRGSGFVTSLEGGYPVRLPLGPGFVLEPQAQIIWQHVSFSDENDGLGPVALGSTSGATGRLGLRGRWTIEGSNGAVWQPYVRANLWRDWGAQASTAFGTDPVPLNVQATRVEFAGGVAVKIKERLSLYGQFGYQFAVSGDSNVRRNGVLGDLGVRYSW